MTKSDQKWLGSKENRDFVKKAGDLTKHIIYHIWNGRSWYAWYVKETHDDFGTNIMWLLWVLLVVGKIGDLQ